MWNKTYSLYPYQQTAAESMTTRDSLLAFEMGCGKTPTTLYAIEKLRGVSFTGSGTVVVPASLKWQWQREVEKFTDQKALVIDGSPSKRKAQYLSLASGSFGYVVMSYDTFVRDWKLHNTLARGFLVLDEATAIKSFDTKRSKHIKKVAGMFAVRFALTGTPVENGKMEEIFSIMQFVDPHVLGRWWDFEKKHIIRSPFGWIEGYKGVYEFRQTLAPYLLRATHKQPEVAKYLPKVLYRDPVMVDLDRATARAVREMESDLVSDLDEIIGAMQAGWVEDNPDGDMMAKIQALRMLLDHPDSVANSALLHASGVGGSKYAAEVCARGLVDDLKSPKMDALEQYINEFLDQSPDNKAVVFCSFVHPALLIAARFGEKAVVFHGGMDPKSRDQAKMEFQTDPNIRLFVSTDAGGYGLDLPQANMLINFDLPWQAGLLKQRNARIRRASSDWKYVVVQDFLVRGTIEERIRAMLDMKNHVADALVDGEGIAASGRISTDLDSLHSFLSNTSK